MRDEVVSGHCKSCECPELKSPKFHVGCGGMVIVASVTTVDGIYCIFGSIRSAQFSPQFQVRSFFFVMQLAPA